MPPTLAEVLSERFDALELGSTIRDRARALGVDASIYNRVLNGHMPLTPKRATVWAKALFPTEPAEALMFAERLLSAIQPEPPLPTVDQFFRSIDDEGGAVPVERIQELFRSLQQVNGPLICVEYRDLPRAGRAAKYESLGTVLAEALANGVSFAMFQPFGADIIFPGQSDPVQSTQSFAAATYMRQVHEKCRVAYLSFRAHLATTLSRSPETAETAEGRPRRGELRLYERNHEKSEAACLGSAFQSKLFYVQWDTIEGGIPTRHSRILQWVSTHARDLLVHRDEKDIDPEAVRDTFFPIPHYFDIARRQKQSENLLPDPTQPYVKEMIEADINAKFGLPTNYYDVWRVWND